MNFKNKVFLSSTQFGDEFRIEREVLPLLFRKEPLSSIFELWKIENQSASVPIDTEYIRNIRQSALVIVLVNSIIRDAVRNEVAEANRNSIPIYVFIRENNARSAEANAFIDHLRSFATTSNFSTIDELFTNVENSLLAYYSPKLATDEENADLERSKQFDIKERSLKIALFTLNQQSEKVTIEKILPLLISEELLRRNATTNELRAAIPIQDKNKVDQALVHMESRLDVINNAGVFSLPAHRIDELRRVSDLVDSEETRAKSKIASLYASLVAKPAGDFLQVLEKCISLIVYKTTSKVNDYSSALGGTAYDAEYLKKIILDSIIVSIGETSNLSVWQKILIEIFETRDPEIVKWLNCIHKSFWFLAAIGCDGQTNSLFRENIEEYNIFFDSHVVLRGMLKAGSQADICSDILARGKKLKVPMFLSEPFFAEVSKAFEQANIFFTNCGGDLNRVIKLLETIERKHDVVDAFIAEKSENPDLEWQEFLSQYYSPQTPQVLETYLRNMLSIGVHRNEEFEVDEWKEIENIIHDLMQRRSKPIERIIKQSIDPQSEEERQFHLRTNEAKQLEVLFKLRAENGPNYWFVTYDRFIYDTCLGIYKTSNSNPKYFPCFIKPNKWLEILTISDKEDLRENVYSEILMSPAMHHAVNNFEASVITEILRRNIDTKVTDKSVLNSMFRDAVNKAATADINGEIISAKDPNQKINSLDDIIRSVLNDRLEKYDKVFRAQNSEIERVKKEKEKAENRARYYRQQVTRLTRKKK